MKTTITACLMTIALAACAVTPPGEERTADNHVPPLRIYIKDMAKPNTGLAEVQFTRPQTFYSGDWPVELAINDVALAKMLPGEKLSIWLKPGASYTFSAKPAQSIRIPTYSKNVDLTIDLTNAGVVRVNIDADEKGYVLRRVE